MPETRVVFYLEDDGTIPALDWLDLIPRSARAKCIERIERLAELGHELRRPLADYLRDGIYELRARDGRVNYRLLYFFHGNVAAVVSHGLTKEKAVPPKEIDLAVRRKERFTADPDLHTAEANNEDDEEALA
jgi:phage-related protein